jgi:hypothetical protein
MQTEHNTKHIPQSVRLDIVSHTVNKRALPSHKPFHLNTTLKSPTEHYFVSFLDTCHN